jgi:hypothetical protein
MEFEPTLRSIPDDELLRRLGDLVSRSRRVEADIVSHVGEVDERRLYLREACPSMFVYCTERLHLSEAETYLRITVARAARQHPRLLTMLSEGRLHLSGIAKLVPLLTRENRDELLGRATHLSKRRIVELVAELAPRPDAPAVIRRLPEQRPLSQEATNVPSSACREAELGPDGVECVTTVDPVTPPTGELAPEGAGPSLELRPDAVETHAAATGFRAHSRPAVVEPLAPARYKVQFIASAELHDKLRRLTALMRSRVPDGDLAAIIEQAVTEKLERLEARRYAQSKAPRKGVADVETAPVTRHVPAAVRRAVSERDGRRCRYVDALGRRCSEERRLELHHRLPFGMGGDHSPANLSLLCPSHNRYLAERDYGQAAIRPRSKLLRA